MLPAKLGARPVAGADGMGVLGATLAGRATLRGEECEERGAGGALVSRVAGLEAEGEREMVERWCEGMVEWTRLSGWVRLGVGFGGWRGRGISEGGMKVSMRVLGGGGGSMARGRVWVLLLRWEVRDVAEAEGGA